MFFCIEITMKLFTAYEQFALYEVIVLQGKQKDFTHFIPLTQNFSSPSPPPKKKLNNPNYISCSILLFPEHLVNKPF